MVVSIKWNYVCTLATITNKIGVLQCRTLSKKSVNVQNNFRFKEEFNETLNKCNRLVSASLMDNSGALVNTSRRKIRELKEIKYRGEILFGIHTVYLALMERKRKFHCLFVKKEANDDTENFTKRSKITELAKYMKIPIHPIDNKGLRYLVPEAVHQGVCLDASPLPLFEWTEDRLNHKLPENSLLIIIDEILDPMNIGAIIRSAYYFGARELFMTKSNSCKLSPTVSKASSGCLEVMNIYHIKNLEHFIKARKVDGYNVISTVAYCENKNCIQPITDLNSLAKTGPSILILGNEGTGISPSIRNLCDTFISIEPKLKLHEGIDSLNVSVAAGIILFALSKKIT